MATKTITVDDLDNDLTADESITFGIDGSTYDIDLTTEHAKKLRDVLAEFIAAGRRTGTRTAPKKASSTGNSETAQIREWARSEGFTVSDRGRVPVEVMEAWNGHKGDLKVAAEIGEPLADSETSVTDLPLSGDDAEDQDQTDEPATPSVDTSDAAVLAWHQVKGYKIPANGQVNGLMRSRHAKAHGLK